MADTFAFLTPLPREECARRLAAALAGDSAVPSRSPFFQNVPYVHGEVAEDRFELSHHDSPSGSTYLGATMLPTPDGGTLIEGRFYRDRAYRFFMAASRIFLCVFGCIMIGVTTYGAFKADPVAWPLAFLGPLLFIGFLWGMLYLFGRADRVRSEVLSEFVSANLGWTVQLEGEPTVE